jgi:hypothetical protein
MLEEGSGLRWGRRCLENVGIIKRERFVYAMPSLMFSRGLHGNEAAFGYEAIDSSFLFKLAISASKPFLRMTV